MSMLTWISRMARISKPPKHDLDIQRGTACTYPIERLVCSCGWTGEWHHQRFNLQTEEHKCERTTK
jgi:hypothetical protein